MRIFFQINTQIKQISFINQYIICKQHPHILTLNLLVILLYSSERMAFHHAQYVYKKVQPFNAEDNHIYKCNASYIQFPQIGQCLSANNKYKRFILKSTTMNVGSQQDEFRSYEGLPCTLKIYRVEPNSKKMIRWHYRVEIKQYLKRRFRKPAYLLPIEAFQALRKVSYVQKEGIQKEFFKTQLLYLFKPYYFLDNLKYILDTHPKVIQIHQLAGYCRSLISCCISYGGLDNFLMTSSNVYFEDDFQNFAINYTSFVGNAFINSKDDSTVLGIQEFLQVYPHLSSSILQNGLKVGKGNIETAIYSKIRSLLVNILNLFVRRDIFFNPIQEKTAQVSRFKLLGGGLIQKLKQYFRNMIKEELKEQKINKIFAHFIQRMRTEYQDNLKNNVEGQDENKKAKKIMKQSLKKLNQKELLFMRSQSSSFITLIEKIFVQEDLNVSWADVLDAFVDYTEKRENKLDDEFQNLHQELWKREQNKQFYLNRGLNSDRIYIPIKFNARFNKLLHYCNWWDFLFEKNFDFEHEAFCAKLYESLIQKHEREQTNIRQDPIFIQITDYMKAPPLEFLSQTSQSQQIKQFIQKKQKLLTGQNIKTD